MAISRSIKDFSNLDLHELCISCGHIDANTQLCTNLLEPLKQWSRIEGCSRRTHAKKEVKEDTFKLNPLKASKRSMGK